MNAIPLRCIKMNEIVNKCLLVGDKFMPEMHLKQRGFTYSACGPFPKNKERIDKFMKAENTDFFYKKFFFKKMKLVFNMMWIMVNQKI